MAETPKAPVVRVLEVTDNILANDVFAKKPAGGPIDRLVNWFRGNPAPAPAAKPFDDALDMGNSTTRAEPRGQLGAIENHPPVKMAKLDDVELVDRPLLMKLFGPKKTFDKDDVELVDRPLLMKLFGPKKTFDKDDVELVDRSKLELKKGPGNQIMDLVEKNLGHSSPAPAESKEPGSAYIPSMHVIPQPKAEPALLRNASPQLYTNEITGDVINRMGQTVSTSPHHVSPENLGVLSPPPLTNAPTAVKINTPSRP